MKPIKVKWLFIHRYMYVSPYCVHHLVRVCEKFVISQHRDGIFEKCICILEVPSLNCPPHFSESRGTLKLIRPSVPLSVRPSVTKTLTWLIHVSSEVLKIEH